MIDLVLVLASTIAPLEDRDPEPPQAVAWPIAAEPSSPSPPVPPSEPPASGSIAVPTSAPSSPPSEPPKASPPPVPAPVSPHVPAGEAERMAPRDIAGGRFKPMGGVTWSSADHKFSLTLATMGQLLYTFQHDDPPPRDRAENVQSLQIRRARMFVSGTAFSPNFKYSLQLQFAPRDLGLGQGALRQSPVFWWFVSYDRFRDLTPTAGLFFVPFSRQRVEAPWKLQFVDNSIAAYEFGFDRDIGLDLKSQDFLGLDKLRYHLGVFMGEGYDYAVPRDFGFLYVARLEVLPFGSFDDYAEADFVRSFRPKLSLGAAYAFNDNDTRRRPLDDPPADGGTTDTHNVTADLHFKIAGLSILADVYWRHGNRRPGDATIEDDDGEPIPAPIELPRNGLGWTAQAGYLLPKTYFEVAGRYAELRPLGRSTSLPHTIELGPGLGYYFVHHALKLQVDYAHQWLPNGATSDRVRLQLTFAL